MTTAMMRAVTSRIGSSVQKERFLFFLLESSGDSFESVGAPPPARCLPGAELPGPYW